MLRALAFVVLAPIIWIVTSILLDDLDVSYPVFFGAIISFFVTYRIVRRRPDRGSGASGVSSADPKLHGATLSTRVESGGRSGTPVPPPIDHAGRYPSSESKLSSGMHPKEEIKSIDSGAGAILQQKEQEANQLMMKAYVLDQDGDTKGAIDAIRARKQLCEEFGFRSSLETCLGFEAMLRKKRGEFDIALKLLADQEPLSREKPNKMGLAANLASQGMLRSDRKEMTQAYRCLREAVLLYRELQLDGSNDLRKALAFVCSELARASDARGETNEALRFYSEGAENFREAGLTKGLIVCLIGQGSILRGKGLWKEAKEKLKSGEYASERDGNTDGLLTTRRELGYVHFECGEYQSALEWFAKEEAVCRELADANELATCLMNQGIIYADFLRNPERALSLLNEAHKVARVDGLEELQSQIQEVLRNVQASNYRSL